MSPDEEGTNNSTGLSFVEPVSSSSNSSAASKPAIGGRSASSVNYTTTEHVLMLDIIADIDGAFDSSVGSPTWQQVHSRTNSQRSKDVLHTHFTEMKSAIASAISTLSVQTPSVRVPTDVAELPTFHCVIFTELSKGKSENKNYQSAKWWSLHVVSKLTNLHFEYLKRNGTSQVQTLKSLTELGAETKRKFDQDQKNKEKEVKEKKAKTEEAEKLLASQRAASLQSQINTGESFKLLAEGMKAFMTPPAAVAYIPQRAEEIVELRDRVTNIESTMKTGFDELKELLMKKA